MCTKGKKLKGGFKSAAHNRLSICDTITLGDSNTTTAEKQIFQKDYQTPLIKTESFVVLAKFWVSVAHLRHLQIIIILFQTGFKKCAIKRRPEKQEGLCMQYISTVGSSVLPTLLGAIIILLYAA